MHFATLTALLALLPVMALSTPVPEPVQNSSVAERALGQTGSYTVSGLGARKQQLLNCGATVLDLAIAMLEFVNFLWTVFLVQILIQVAYFPRTERMSTDYTYGDGKSSDSANFVSTVLFWPSLPADAYYRACSSRTGACSAAALEGTGERPRMLKLQSQVRIRSDGVIGLARSDYNTGAELNSNLCLDISSRHESMNYYGEGKPALTTIHLPSNPRGFIRIGTWFAGHRNGARYGRPLRE